MNLVKCAILLLGFALPANLSAGERLVYAVNHGIVGDWNTEIFVVSPDNPQPTLIFSDETSPIKLGFLSTTGTSAPPQTVVFQNRLFAPGKERTSKSTARATGIFEFDLANSGKSRKILDLPTGERVDEMIVDGSASRLAYLSLGATNLSLFIHDIKTGNLLRKLDLTRIQGGCVLRNFSWLPDNKTLFFTLEEGVDGFMEDNDSKRIGAWTMLDDGTLQTRLPVALGKLQVAGYRSDQPPILLGIVNGQYLLYPRLYQTSKPANSSIFLALADPRSGASTAVTLETPPGLSAFTLSRSGRYLAYAQQDKAKFVGSSYVVSPVHLWAKSLPTGDAKELFSLDINKERGSWLAILGWASD
jgi:hypothetical protein